MPEADAEDLLQEAMFAFAMAEARIDDPRAWLVAAICNGARHYWRKRNRRGEEMFGVDIPHPAYTVDHLETELLVRQVLRELPPKARDVLRLHYLEGMTERDLAFHYGTTSQYARKLITKALQRFRRCWTDLQHRATRHGLPEKV